MTRVLIGWADHELEWLRAASTLPYDEKQEAFKDIASMCQRPIDAVRKKAIRLKYDDSVKAGKAKARARFKAACIVVSKQPQNAVTLALSPSEIQRPSMAALMGGRARVTRRTMEAA